MKKILNYIRQIFDRQKESIKTEYKEKLVEFGFEILSINPDNIYSSDTIRIGTMILKKPNHLIIPKRQLDNIDIEIIELYNSNPLGLLTYVPTNK